MLKLFLMIVAIAAFFCLCVVILFLFSALSENELPDIEDVEVG
ncbi:MAG: hypothetical protein U9N83_02910 [Thermodesulfobacteriota bacterium]|nr:hypothetical protein [Thermodesulfobacteriota bacterium]